MKKKVFIETIAQRCNTNSLTFRTVVEQGIKIWLYYNKGTHVGTWIDTNRFFFLNDAKGVIQND